MISTLGQILVLLSLLICAAGAPLGFIAGARRSAAGLVLARRLAIAYGALMLLATLAMEYALLTRDFSVSYVAQVGSHATPTHITIVSLWSSLEGSILFWGLILGAFTAAVAVLQRRGHEDYLAYTLGTLFAVGIFFTYLISSFCVATAGLIQASRTMGAQNTVGQGMELEVLAAVILGGASLLGGSGTVFKTVIGVLILGFIQNGLLLAGLEFYAQFVVTWIIIILAVWLDIATKRGRLWSLIS